MSKGLMVFTDGKEVIGARINRISITSDQLEIMYDYRVENVGYTGVLKASSSDGANWSGEWTDKNQKWKSTSGRVQLAGVKGQDRGLFHGTWGEGSNDAGEEVSFSIELPRGYR